MTESINVRADGLDKKMDNNTEKLDTHTEKLDTHTGKLDALLAMVEVKPPAEVVWLGVYWVCYTSGLH